MAKNYNIAILGATGAVGKELLELLDSRDFPVADLRLLASNRSVGERLSFKGANILVEEASDHALSNVDIVLASAGSSISKTLGPIAVEKGAIVIDNSSAFRMSPEVPLVIPEVNPNAITKHQGIIANPNCTTILMALVVWPLHQVQQVKRIVAATYQSASGAGAKAIAEVKTQAQEILEGRKPTTEVFPYPLAFNLFPHNSPLNDFGYCEEEMKMVNETRKIFNDSNIRISATCVRVPVLRAHSEAINLEFNEPFFSDKAREILSRAPGVKLVEDWQANHFPMPIAASGENDVLVGRIRQDISHPCGLELWLCGDQIRKGAALNAIQISELLVERQLVKGAKLSISS
ncbi:Aspartate-semialdehyde dehydrogenase [Richelia intracellularis HH01]|uniref:Aspartate-semialdehyde dehydrogenase n=1 Tax=Richelia intracellularis HH01 TaxID=1165094 RepID=M1X3E5_9NOST|nr:aspartate-semialdehyde dehydrogenase [Richelia intracellularis]CCH68415.1 Aspartate-semialdehyde dehydrogenase [Richelia intracellularis HH01]HAE05477.1 aspartate-semialdehyde dehydrogenase [Richelia sp.]